MAYVYRYIGSVAPSSAIAERLFSISGLCMSNMQTMMSISTFESELMLFFEN